MLPSSNSVPTARISLLILVPPHIITIIKYAIGHVIAKVAYTKLVNETYEGHLSTAACEARMPSKLPRPRMDIGSVRLLLR
jgi:hypothetical protein